MMTTGRLMSFSQSVLVVGAEDDDRLGPLDAVLALDQGDALLRSPGEPHAVGVALLENGDVEAGAEVAAEHRVLGRLHPAGGRLGSNLSCPRAWESIHKRNPKTGRTSRAIRSLKRRVCIRCSSG